MMPKPLPRFVSPKYMRLPRRRKVTIAAGFSCVDGIVLCADTQETIQGYTKTKTEKMNVLYADRCRVVITGSGDSEIVGTISQRLMSAAISEFDEDRWYEEDEVRGVMEDVLLEFFRRHLLPYPQIERPFIELLIAVRCSRNRFLYKASGNTLRDLDPARTGSSGASAIGSGCLFANSLIERIYSPFLELDDLVTIACYILYQAKRWVDGCGGNTDIYVMTKEGDLGIRSHDIEAMEKMFAHCDENYDHLLAYSLNPNTPSADIAKSIGRLRAMLFKDSKALLTNRPELREFFGKIRRPTKLLTDEI